MTWIPFLSMNREQFRVVRSNADLETVSEGVFLVLSTSMLGKLKRGLARFVRRTSRKLCLVFDESDEITTPSSQRTRHILSLFRRLRYKILDTGTTTRNNIAELYSQFKLLYNNSINMILLERPGVPREQGQGNRGREQSALWRAVPRLPTLDRGLFRRRDSEQDKVHREAGTEDTRQGGCRLHVHSRIRPLREPSPRMFS